MGTQQILLIVLSVIIVGIAVAVGISMFNAQSLNSARQAIASDMNNYAVQAQTYWKTPTNMGGAGYTDARLTNALLRAYIGGATMTNDNGLYFVACDNTAAAELVVFGCTPKEGAVITSIKSC